MKRIFASLLALTAMTSVAMASPSADEKLVQSELSRYAKSHELQLDSFDVIPGKVDGNDSEDLVVVFAMNPPGGNMIFQEMTVFLREGNKLKMVKPINVGSKLAGAVEQVTVSDNTIHLMGHRLAKNDPLCCPSIPYKVDAGFVPGKGLVLFQ